MRVLWSMTRYLPKVNAGAEWYAHEINKHLISQGHEVTVMLRHPCDYEIDGVKVVLHDTKLYKSCDIVFTQLEAADRAIGDSIRFGKPVVYVAHNTFANMMVRRHHKVGVILNSKAALNICGYAHHERRRIVLRPPIDIDYYSVPKGDKYTLINLCDNKGPATFYKLAQLFPNKQFLGVVGGYHRQQIQQHDNVEIMQHTTDIREAYRKTRILLMPSRYESWGRTATEAMASGIPVIAHPTFGLQENIGDAGLYADRAKPDQWVKAIEEIESNYEHWSQKALNRAKELRTDFKEFDLFLSQMLSNGS